MVKRSNGAIVKEATGKPITLHVDLDRGVWCKGICRTMFHVQRVQGELIRLAEADREPFHTSISIMPSVNGYTEDILVDVRGHQTDEDTDGECQTLPFQGIR